MGAHRYVLMACASAFLVPWLVSFIGFPACRRALVWSSLAAAVFGLSEPLFAGSYWSPPSLFDLARRAHLDLESFVFLFGAGGVAAVAYNVAARRPIDVVGSKLWCGRRRERYNVALAMPAVVFSPALLVLRTPIAAAVTALGAGAVARVVCRPDLLRKTLLGGGLFLALYVMVLEALARLDPGYVQQVWSHQGPLLRRVDRLPIAELLFGATFGAYWSGLYEHWHWTFFRPRRSRPQAPPGSSRSPSAVAAP